MSEHTTAIQRAPRVGILVRLWRFLFGDPQPPPPPRPQLYRCSAETVPNVRCMGIEDPRCQGRNCTEHCRRHCPGTCLPGGGSQKTEDAPGTTLSSDPDPTLGGTCYLATCRRCQAVNRIPKDKSEGQAVCGRCHALLLRPS